MQTPMRRASALLIAVLMLALTGCAQLSPNSESSPQTTALTEAIRTAHPAVTEVVPRNTYNGFVLETVFDVYIQEPDEELLVEVIGAVLPAAVDAMAEADAWRALRLMPRKAPYTGPGTSRPNVRVPWDLLDRLGVPDDGGSGTAGAMLRVEVEDLVAAYGGAARNG